MVELALHAEPLERQHHARAEIAERVVRRRRKVALLLADRVAEAGLAGVPVAFARVDLVARLVLRARIRDLVEDEELALGADVVRVGDACRAQVLLRTLRNKARILRVRLVCHGLDDLADEREGRHLGVRVEDRRRRVRHQQHVALRDALPAADRRAVEAEPFVERGLVERADGQGHVLPRAEQVAELQVDHRRARLARPFERLARLDRALEVMPQFLLDLCHLDSFSCWTTKKAPPLPRSDEASLPRRPPSVADVLSRTLADQADRSNCRHG
jgi:hypothetical protein